jgi:hypothetical protein
MSWLSGWSCLFALPETSLLALATDLIIGHNVLRLAISVSALPLFLNALELA